jgi:hypothetical protein
MHMRRCLRPTLVALAAVATATPAAGAAGWSAPQTASAPHTFAGPLTTAIGGDGTLVAAWPWQDSRPGGATRGAATATRPPQAAFGPERPAPAGLVDVVAYGRTRTLALAQQEAGGRPGATGAIRFRLRVAAGTVAGGFGAARTLVTAPVLGRPQLAVDARGSALVSWIEPATAHGRVRRIVRAIERRGGRWGAPFTLVGTGRTDTLAGAMSTRGDAAIALVREGVLLARVRRAGRPWGTLQAVARATGPTRWQLLLRIDERGQVRLIWRRHQLRRESVPGRTALEGAALLVGRGRFTTGQTILPDGASGLAVTQAAGGWALVTTATTPDGPRPVLFRTHGGSAFGPAEPAAPAQGGIRGADVAFSPAAGITVAWIQPIAGQDSDGQVRAATLPIADPSAAFGPVEEVSPAEAAHEVSLAPDPRAGQPVALWTARPGGTGPGIPLAQIQTVVRSAVRMP